MRLRPRLLAILVAPLTLAACLGDTTRPLGSPLDCRTPALAVSGGTSTGFTQTASGLLYRDDIVGTGATAVSGSTVGMHYSGCLLNGSLFDYNMEGDELQEFMLGEGKVITGLDEGVTGMRVGGRRTLVLPSTLAYGPNNFLTIPGGSTVVFVIDLVALR